MNNKTKVEYKTMMVSFRVDKELSDSLMKACKTTGIPRSAYLRTAIQITPASKVLTEWLRNRPKQIV